MKNPFCSLTAWCWLTLNLCAVKAPGASGDENWEHFKLPPGLNGPVSSVLMLGRHIYVGGSFTKAGEAEAVGIARWDGQRWSSLGLGLQGIVNALAARGTDLYVGGIFTLNGSIAATNIAKWTGERWDALGSGIAHYFANDEQQVSALAVRGKDLYVGGRFRNAGGVEALNVAKWDGRRWASLGDGVGGAPRCHDYEYEYSGEVRALVFHGPYLYAGGLFHSAGGVLTTNLARWDGRRWTGFHPGVSGSVWWRVNNIEYGGAVNTLAVRGKELYVGGVFTNIGGVPARNLARWNGSTWAEVGGGVDGPVGSILRQGKNFNIGGYFRNAGGQPATNLARWNGFRWSTVGEGVRGSVSALALKGTQLYAGGSLGMAGRVPAASFARWDGRVWSALGQGVGNAPMNRPFVLAAHGQNIYVGGYTLHSAGNVPVNNLAKWNGTRWSDVGGGIAWGGVSAIALSGDKVYVRGAFALPEVGAMDIACWDGASWSALGSGLREEEFIGYPQVMAVSEGNLYVAGSFTAAGDIAATNLAVWNGSQWSEVGGGVTWMLDLGLSRPGSVYAMAVDGRDVYVGGSFTHAGSIAATNLARWDGQTWSAVGGGLPLVGGHVACLAVGGGSVYVAVMPPNTADVSHLFKWNGATWHELSVGTTADIRCLAVSERYLYVGGRLNPFDGPSAGVLRWDGTQWSELGSGVNGFVYALAADAGLVSMLGSFDTAGGKSSFGFAVWHETAP